MNGFIDRNRTVASATGRRFAKAPALLAAVQPFAGSRPLTRRCHTHHDLGGDGCTQFEQLHL